MAGSFMVFAPRASAAGCAGTGSCYWIGGSGNWSDTAHWSTTSGDVGGQTGSVPTSADDVYFDVNSSANSYTVTVDVTANCKDMTWANPGSGSPTLAGSGGLYIYGSVTLVSGMTWSQNGQLLWRVSSGTKIWTSNGVTITASLNIYTAGGTYQLGDDLNIGGTGPQTITYTAGTFDPNGKTVTLSAAGNSVIGNMTFYTLVRTGGVNKTSSLTLNNNVTVTHNLTINGNSATNRVLVASDTIGTPRVITLSAGAAGLVTTSGNFDLRDIQFNTGGQNLDLSGLSGGTVGGGTVSGAGMSGGGTLTLTAGKSLYWRHPQGTTYYFSDSYFTTSPDTLGSENLTNPVLTSGTSWARNNDCVLSGDAATWSYSGGALSSLYQTQANLAVAIVANAFYKLTFTASSISGTPTAALGSATASGVTFPIVNGVNTIYFKAAAAPTDFYFQSTLTAGQAFTIDNLTLKQVTGYCPLIQDTAVFDADSFKTTGRTVIQDMPRIPTTDFTGATNSPTFTTSATASVFGSLTLISGMTLTASTQLYTFEGRGDHTLTSAGKTFAKGITLNAPSGTLTLQDAFTNTTTLEITNGMFVGNDNNVTTLYFKSGAGTQSMNLGSGTWTMTGNVSSYAWNMLGGAPTIINSSLSVIKLIDSSATTPKYFAGNGKTYGNLWISPESSAAEWQITGSNTFTGYLKDDGTAAHAVKFTKSTNTTIADWQIGTAASRAGNTNVITLDTVDGAGSATLTKSGGGVVSADYLNVNRIICSPANTWYLGSHSVDGGTNSGCIFSDAPVSGGGNTRPNFALSQFALETKETEATLSWQTPETTSYSLAWGKQGALTPEEFISPEMKKDFSHTISNLKPDTAYTYTLSVKGEREGLDVKGEFKTLPESGLTTPASAAVASTNVKIATSTARSLQDLVLSLQKQLLSLLTQLLVRVRR